jgi:hypothetical protein
MCCTACFVIEGKFIRPKKLVCKYLSDDNSCPIYNNRKETLVCLAAKDLGFSRPVECAFGGLAKTTDGTELFITPPKELVGLLLTGIFKWRYI